MKNIIALPLSIVLTTQVMVQEKILSGDGDIAHCGSGRLADETGELFTSDFFRPSPGLTKLGKF